MKKLIAMVLAMALVFALAACNGQPAETTGPVETTTAPVETTTAPVETTVPVETTEADNGVMTYEEYAAAPLDSAVVVEFYVQDHQSWYKDTINVYGQDEVGGYYAYNLACSEEDAAKLVPGTKIRVTGYKSEWSGEVEITDATFEIVEGSYIAEPVDVTALLGTEELAARQNMLVSFTGLTVVPCNEAGAAFQYNWDGSGSQGNDLYFNVAYGSNVYTFCVESYLRGADTEVYKAVEALQVGDVINLEGFLYWYNGAQPHIISVSAFEDTKAEGTVSYADYAAAALDSAVVVEFYVQGHQSWYKDTINVYGQDLNGGYYAYNMACSEEDAAKLVPGTKIRVTGYKSEWSGEVELTDASFEIIDGHYVAAPVDVTAVLGTDELANYMNMKVAFKGMTVVACNDAGAAFQYNWDGSGSQGNDLYFKVALNGQEYTFCVESYLCGAETEVYKAIEALQVGDVIDLEGFLYWYNGAQPHITAVKTNG